MIVKRARRPRSGQPQRFAYSPMIWVKDASGRYQLWGGTYRTKAEAKAAERALLNDRDAGKDLRPSNVTVAELCNQYVIEKRTKVKTSSLQRSEELLANLLPLIGTTVAARLRPADVSAAYDQLLTRLSKRKVRHCHWQLHGVLELAVRWGQIPGNAAARVNPPQPDAFEGRALTREELRALFEVLPTKPLAPLVMLALDSAAREGELLALRWEDIDFEPGVIHIGRSVRKIKDSLVFTEPKTRRSKRSVEVSVPTISVLKAHRQRQLEHRLRLGDVWTDLGLVFPTELGSPQSGSYISRAFRKIAAEAGITNVRFHDLRHSSVSLLLQSGEPMANVSRRAGHATIGVTVDTYGHHLGAGGSMAATMGEIIERSIGGNTERWLANG